MSDTDGSIAMSEVNGIHHEGGQGNSSDSSSPATRRIRSWSSDLLLGEPSSSSATPRQQTSSSSSSSSAVPLRHPAPVRPADAMPIVTPASGSAKHHHQRSRSVNLSPTMQGGSFTPPNTSLSWDNNRLRGSSPSLPSSSRQAPMARSHPHLRNGVSPSSAASHDSGLASHQADPPASSPGPLRPSETGRRSSLQPGGLHDRSSLSAAGWEGSSKRTSSPARAYALPISPRLQAYSASRMRRSSSSSSSSSNGSGHGSPPHRPSSPMLRPGSPRAMDIAISPDPNHPFDAVWPEAMSSPSTSPRGRDAHSPLQARRLRDDGSAGLPSSPGKRGLSPVPYGSPSGAAGGRGSPFDRNLRSSASAVHSPTLGPSRVGQPSGHRRTPSGGSGHASPSSSLENDSLSSSPLGSSYAAKAAAEPTRHTSSQEIDEPPRTPNSELEDPTSSGPMLKILSPSKSSVQVDAHSVHAEGSSNAQVGSQSDTSGFSLPSGSSPSGALYPPSLLGRRKSGESVRSSSPFSHRGTSPGPSGSPASPAHFAESPPKTRSFIGMPPRSGYELSDDPDDVGSEDGASVSSGKASNADEDEERDMSEDEREEEGERDMESDDNGPDSDGETFTADEEDLESSWKRREAAEQEQEDSGPTELPLQSADLPLNSRPALPKRPSLTRSAAVPAVPSPPQDTVTQQQPVSMAASMLHRFQDDQGTVGAIDERSSASSEPVPVATPAIAPAVDGTQSEPDANDALLADVELPASESQGTEQDGANQAGDATPTTAEQREESLSTLERIFLFAKSEMAYHRVIVSRSLPTWLREVELSEAVEYVISLLNGLATDEVDVCAAFASELHHTMWYFYKNCPLVERDPQQSEQQGETGSLQESATRPRLAVGAFTPLICALLLNQNAVVANTAQSTLVTFFKMLHREEQAETEEERAVVVTHAEGREGESVQYEQYRFDSGAKQAVAQELLEHVAFAMGRLHTERHEQEQDSSVQNQDGQDGPIPTEETTSSQPEPSTSQDHDGDSSWDAEMQDESQAIDDWHRAASPFDSSSPMFSYDKPDVDEEAAIGRMASISLLSALSADDAVPSQLVADRFLKETISLKDDPTFYVRKEAAIALGSFSKHMPHVESIVDELLPAFEGFADDKIWHVRQATCSSLPALFKQVKGPVRREKVVTLMRKFSSDVSQNVRTACLEIIGEAIYLFDGEEQGVPEELVRYFLGEPFDVAAKAEATAPDTTQGDDAQSSNNLYSDFGFAAAMNGNGSSSNHALQDSQWETDFMSMPNSEPDRPLVMAYNFPAVVLTLTGDAWPRLRQAHLELSNHASGKVRQSLAASLHEIAKLIGLQATNDDLLPLMNRFLSSNEDDSEVRAAALENAHVLLGCLPRETAVQQLSSFKDLWSTSFAHDWRLRQSLALQVSPLADNFVVDDEEGNLMSLMQTALSDPISSVRDAGVKAAPAMYANFAEHDQTVADGVLGMLADMGEAEAYRTRVGFLLAAHALVDSRIQRSSFQLIVLPRLCALATDPVVDVRMALVKVVVRMCQVDELFALPSSRSPELTGLLQSLARDSSSYIRDQVRGLFSTDDPIWSMAPYSPVHGRRAELTLGPADGGPHRQPRQTLAQTEPAMSRFISSMDCEEDGDQQEEQARTRTQSLMRFPDLTSAMDEDDDDDDDGPHHSESDGDYDGNDRILMSEHDIDSDLEMVNIDPFLTSSSSASIPRMGDVDSSMFEDIDDEEDELQHHGLDSDDDEVPFDLHRYDDLKGGDDAEDEEEDISTADRSMEEAPHHLLSLGDSRQVVEDDGNDEEPSRGSMLSLTSPERFREGPRNEATPQLGEGGVTSNGSPFSVKTYGKKDRSASTLSSVDGSTSDATAQTTQEEQKMTRAPDPFLSFVSGALGPLPVSRERSAAAAEAGKVEVDGEDRKEKEA